MENSTSKFNENQFQCGVQFLLNYSSWIFIWSNRSHKLFLTITFSNYLKFMQINWNDTNHFAFQCWTQKIVSLPKCLIVCAWSVWSCQGLSSQKNKGQYRLVLGFQHLSKNSTWFFKFFSPSSKIKIKIKRRNSKKKKIN
jgi:hypothetical protein